MSAEEHWLKIKEQFLKMKDVQKQGEALKIKKKMFVFLNMENITVKLPKERVTELLNSGEGLPYDPGNGKIMKEWVTIPLESSDKWIAFAKEGMRFALTLAK
ncbi:MAG: hypothetical protein GNW80_16105 [Asgard group archaeon]|nr:hypothetical protein [Asgard group archaeon]